jgi:hypothetical protein
MRGMPDPLPDLDHWLTNHRRWYAKPRLLWQCLRYELERLGLASDDARVRALLGRHSIPLEPQPPVGSGEDLGAIARGYRGAS